MTSEATGTPTRVVLYSYAKAARPEAAAEFRWSPESGVTLHVIDPVEGEIARRYFEQGLFFEAENRIVPASEATAFMQALVQPSRSSYSQFVDESPRDEQGERG